MAVGEPLRVLGADITRLLDPPPSSTVQHGYGEMTARTEA